MKKPIAAEYILLIGLVCFGLKYIIGGTIGALLGTIGIVLILVGAVQYFNNRKK